MRILLYGSAYMTSLAERALFPFHTIVGHVPNKFCRFPGQMQSRPVDPAAVSYDVALSVLYDQKITQLERAYNIHPALLPQYAGVNTSFWALRNGAREFGWTCHRITEKFDDGPILTKVTFPLLVSDSSATVYKRQASILPCFVRTCLKLIEELGDQPLHPQCRSGRDYYSQAQFDALVDPMAKCFYSQSGEAIRAYVKEQTS